MNVLNQHFQHPSTQRGDLQWGGVDGDRDVLMALSYSGLEGYRDVLPTRSLLTIPTDLEKTGNFSGRKDRAGNLIQIYDPLTTTSLGGNRYTRSPFAEPLRRDFP